MNIEEQFTAATGLKVRSQPGSKLTTYAIGGEIARLIEPENTDELIAGLKFLYVNAQKFRILGAGSNLLIDDQGLSEWVIRLGRGFRDFKAAGKQENGKAVFEVGASVSLMRLARDLSEQGLSGLEFAGGIPASLGGAVRMNAGAHGGQMSDLIESVDIINPAGEQQTLKAEQIIFNYRNCSIPRDSIVTSARLVLKVSDRESTATARAAHLAERKKRQPLSLPSAGSVFKNPAPDKSAGFLIEQCGLKGFKEGGAEISNMHANWIVNPERRGSAANVLRLINICREKVQEKFAIELEQEVIFWTSQEK